MDGTKLNLLEKNIKILESGITLQEYVEHEEQIKIDGDTKIYNEYGFYVVYNKTKNLYLLDGGNNTSGFTMSVTIKQYFISNNGCGNPYMHKHYMDGDMIVLFFWRYDSQQYNSMAQLKERIEAYYDSIGETYYDFIAKMQDPSYTKEKRPNGYNPYYRGKTQEKMQDKTQGKIQEKTPVKAYEGKRKERRKSVAAALLHLEKKSKFLYQLLNAIVDLLIKPFPIFVWELCVSTNGLFAGENALQVIISLVSGIFTSYVLAVLSYVALLFVVQIVKLFVCTYKPLVIHFRVFDMIIRLSRNKILAGDDRELKELLYQHETMIENRKERRENGKSKAYERKRKRDMEELAYAQQDYQRAKDSAQRNRQSAQQNYKKADEGGTLFSSAETKREEAKRDARRAAYDEENARYYEERIRAKERALGIKHKD